MIIHRFIYKLKTRFVFMKIYFPLIKSLINYLQEKQANIELGNIFADRVQADCKIAIENSQNSNQDKQMQSFSYFMGLGESYQKNPQFFQRPKQPSKLQKIIFNISNRLDEVFIS